MLLFYTGAVVFLVGVFAATPIVEDENETPVIGILSQEISYNLEQTFPGQYKSYIAASYVKFVEGGGARVVPIWIDKDKQYYEDILGKVNGVLFPGGSTWFNQSNGYADAGLHIFEIAKSMNENGTHLPLWGTCLGFELLLYLDAGTENRAHCKSSSQPLALDFKKDSRDSRLFGSAPDRILKALANEPITANFHQYCITEQNMTEFDTDRNWKILSLNKDWDNFEFISSVESKRYPFYGVQFHPEKNIYEWVPKRNISHTASAVEASQYFAQFLVSEARKSPNRYDPEELKSDLIYNYPTTYTGASGSAFEECYLFGDPPKKKVVTAAATSVKESCQSIISDDDVDEIDCNEVY